jgi:hypothetical protein
MKIPFFDKEPKLSRRGIPVLGASQIVHSQNRTKAAAASAMTDRSDTVPPQLTDSQYDTIADLKKTVLKQTIVIGRQSAASKTMAAVGFVVGGILSGAGVGIHGQMAPDSWLQSSMSFLAGKFSDGKTGFDIVRE